MAFREIKPQSVVDPIQDLYQDGQTTTIPVQAIPQTSHSSFTIPTTGLPKSLFKIPTYKPKPVPELEPEPDPIPDPELTVQEPEPATIQQPSMDNAIFPRIIMPTIERNNSVIPPFRPRTSPPVMETMMHEPAPQPTYPPVTAEYIPPVRKAAPAPQPQVVFQQPFQYPPQYPAQPQPVQAPQGRHITLPSLPKIDTSNSKKFGIALIKLAVSIILVWFGLTSTGSYFGPASGRFGGQLAQIFYQYQLGVLIACIGIVLAYDALHKLQS